LTTRISNSKNTVELYDADYENNEITTEVALAATPQFNTTILTSILILRNVTQERVGGKYQCIVSNYYGTTYSDKSRIAVVTHPKFRKQPQDIVVQAGKTARLDCAAEGDPKPQIYWEKDGGNDFTAAREKRMQVMPEDDAFFITNVKVSDMGTYACTAESLGGIIKANATLVVYESPSFVRPMENKEVISGKSSVLECMASGFPRPKLEWLKDSRPIDTTGRHFFAADQQLLIIVDTSVSDAGVYKCTMTNDLGTKFDYMKLTVLPVASSLGVGTDFLGIIVIIVVTCCVGTSIIWVIIIYQTRRRSNGVHYEPSNLLNIVPAMPSAKDKGSAGSSPDYTAVDDGDSFSNENGVLSSQNDSIPPIDIDTVDNATYMIISQAARATPHSATTTSLCTNDGAAFDKISYENSTTLEACTPHNSDDEPAAVTPTSDENDNQPVVGGRNDQLEPLLTSSSGSSTPTIVQLHKKPVTVTICENGTNTTVAASPTK
jgi:Immunoglobulin I-set domain